MAPSLAVDVLTVSELRGLFATHFYSMLDVRCWMFDVLEFKQEHRTFNTEHRSRLNHTQKTRRDESYFSPRRVLHRRSTVWRCKSIRLRSWSPESLPFARHPSPLCFPDRDSPRPL